MPTFLFSSGSKFGFSGMTETQNLNSRRELIKIQIQCPLRRKQKRVANKLSLELRDRIIPHFQRLGVELLSGTEHSQL